jgi:hypothetical protein
MGSGQDRMNVVGLRRRQNYFLLKNMMASLVTYNAVLGHLVILRNSLLETALQS